MVKTALVCVFVFRMQLFYQHVPVIPTSYEHRIFSSVMYSLGRPIYDPQFFHVSGSWNEVFVIDSTKDVV